MPRTKLGEKYAPKTPPLDPAWGAVLCRMRQMDMDMKTLASLTGYSYDVIRHSLIKPPIEWSPAQRDAILVALGLKAELVIKDRED